MGLSLMESRVEVFEGRSTFLCHNKMCARAFAIMNTFYKA